MLTVVSLEDFAITVEKLNPNCANWVTFQSQFITAVRQMGVYEHLDGSNPKPCLANEDLSAEKAADADELAVWDRKANLALYMLSMKLPDLVFAKSRRIDAVEAAFGIHEHALRAERSMGTCQSESKESEGNAPGGSRSGSSSERSRSRSRDPDVSAAPLEEDSNDAGGISALAIEAVIELSTDEVIDEVDEPDVMEMLGECDKLDVVNVADVVVFRPNSSLPPCNPRWKRRDRADVEESHGDESKGDIIVIPTELKNKEVDVPMTVFEKSWSSELANDLEGCISLDAGCLGSLESGWADEPKADGDMVQAQIPDSGRALAAVCVLMVAAVIVGMENLENGTLHELNEEMNDTGQHTLKEPSTIDARVITEGVRSIAFDAEACLADVEPHLDDPGGSLMLCALIDDENREICWRNKRLVSANENFIFDGEKDVLGLDSIVDESRGSDSLEGLNPDGISIEDVRESRTGRSLSLKAFGTSDGVQVPGNT
ncbi:hypothetical protein F5887DRAFT_1078995 [Amanita rubescens]|nr:hypothetical protein F5887DRAFT_1078995 [Amanita rubescens]